MIEEVLYYKTKNGQVVLRKKTRKKWYYLWPGRFLTLFQALSFGFTLAKIVIEMSGWATGFSALVCLIMFFAFYTNMRTNWHRIPTILKIIFTGRFLEKIPKERRGMLAFEIFCSICMGLTIGSLNAYAVSGLFSAAGLLGALGCPPLMMGLIFGFMVALVVTGMKLHSIYKILKQAPEDKRSFLRKCWDNIKDFFRLKVGDGKEASKLQKGIFYTLLGLFIPFTALGVVTLLYGAGYDLVSLLDLFSSIAHETSEILAYGLCFTFALMANLPFVIMSTASSIKRIMGWILTKNYDFEEKPASRLVRVINAVVTVFNEVIRLCNAFLNGFLSAHGAVHFFPETSKDDHSHEWFQTLVYPAGVFRSYAVNFPEGMKENFGETVEGWIKRPSQKIQPGIDVMGKRFIARTPLRPSFFPAPKKVEERAVMSLSSPPVASSRF